MNVKLLIVDCDGTVSKIRNPFLSIASELSCDTTIKRYTDEYIAGRISYNELVSLQNPVFLEAGRNYANERGLAKCDASVFEKLLLDLVGGTWVLPEMIRFLNTVRSSRYEIAMISSGWDAVISRAAAEAGIDYWRANGVLFTDGEFGGTSVRVRADKIDAFESAVHDFGSEYKGVCYLGDSEFDLVGMEFIHEKGGKCLVHERSDYERGIPFPPYVMRFASLEQMGEYLRSRE